MQYHQVRILCALQDKIWNADKSLTREQAMTLAFLAVLAGCAKALES